MWIFSTLGFFSVVSHRSKPKHLLVRARDRAHLAALLEDLRSKAAIASTPDADYPFRIEIARERFSKWLAKHTASIDYDNFKGAVEQQTATQSARSYVDTLHEIWAVARRRFNSEHDHDAHTGEGVRELFLGTYPDDDKHMAD